MTEQRRPSDAACRPDSAEADALPPSKEAADVVVFEATTDAELMSVFPVIAQLRTHLNADAFIPQVRRQAASGYRVLALRRTTDSRVVAAAGYRFTENLAIGRFVYVDDLVTDATLRSCGYGSRILNAVFDVAREAGVTEVHLDSAVHREDAHRFYFRERMGLVWFHFRRTVSTPAPPL